MGQKRAFYGAFFFLGLKWKSRLISLYISTAEVGGYRLDIVLVIVILFTAIGTFMNSLRSRRAKKGTREALRAKMNMHMGVMFLCIAGLQLTSFGGSAFQFVVTMLIALLGIFNLFAGYRNYQHFRKFLS